MEKALMKVGSIKAGSFWLTKKAKEEFNNISGDINTISNTVEEKAKWIFNKLKVTQSRSLTALTHLPSATATKHPPVRHRPPPTASTRICHPPPAHRQHSAAPPPTGLCRVADRHRPPPTASTKRYSKLGNRKMWETSMKGLQSLVRRTTPSSFTYLCEKMGSSFTDKMDELACFAPGMLALGSSGYGPGDSQKFLSLAEELAWTCYNFYQSTPTKLAGENYFFSNGQDMSVGTSWNILRPETVESLFYLWRITGNKTYQEWGWNIFQAFEKNSRVESGYVGLKDVNTGVKDNMMQSFFLAETLKYLYLLFSPPSVIPLDQWVFNTEAHPLKIVTRRDHAVSTGKHGSERQSRSRREGRFGN